MPENINWLAVAGVVFQCLTGLMVIASAYSAWTGINKNKVAAAKTEPATSDDKKEPGKPWLIAATVLVVLALVFGCFGTVFSLPSALKESNPNPTETPPTPMPNGSTPIPPQNDFTSYCNPAMPTGKTFTAPQSGVRLPNGSEITQGKAYMYRVINWSEDCKNAEVYLLFTLYASEYRIAGPNFDGYPNHDQQTWAYEGDNLESIMPKEMCELARETLSGGLGKDTSVVVHYSNQTDGQYVEVPLACRP